MFCSSCGQAMQSFEQVCPRCGRTVPPMTAGRMPFAYSRVQRHVQVLGYLWIGYAILSVAGWLIALPFMAGIFGHWGFHHGFGPGFPFPMVWLPGFITAIVAVRGVLAAMTGVALLRRAPWGRTLAIITAFLTLIKPFVGTALAIYTLWVLLPAPSGQEYEQIAVP